MVSSKREREQMPLCFVPLLIVAFCFLFSTIPAKRVVWTSANVTMPATNCNKYCDDLRIYMHPFRAVELYNSQSTWLAEIDWQTIGYNVQTIQACMILAIIFLFLAVFCIEEYCGAIQLVFLTASIICSSIALGIWNPTANLTIPFWNVNLTYTGDILLCRKKNDCRKEKDFNVIYTNVSKSLIELTVNDVSYGFEYNVWIAGVAILCFIYVWSLVWAYMQRIKVKNIINMPFQEQENRINLT